MDYEFDDNRIEPCYLVNDNDIGDDIGSLLNFDKHIYRIVATAYSRIRLLFMCFVSRNVLVFR